MKQRLYIDTSVFGGYFDEEFSEFTRPLFSRIQNGEFRLLFSEITQDELTPAPEKVQELVRKFKILISLKSMRKQWNWQLNILQKVL